MKLFKTIGSIAMTFCLVLLSTFIVGCKPKLESIYIVPDSIASSVAQNLEFTYPNLKVMAKYSDKSEIEIKIEDLTITNINTQNLGEQTFKVEYQGKVATKKIMVTKTIKSISLKNGIQSEVYRYENLNTLNAVITVTYIDDSTEEIPYSLNSGIVFGEIDTTTAGDKTLTINFGGKQTTFNFTVVDVSSIEYVSGLDEDIYVDDFIDVNNFVIKINYVNGQSKNLISAKNSGVEITGVDTSFAGDKVLTIKYKDIPSITKEYTVKQDTVVSASIKEGSVENSVVANEVLNTDNLVLTLTYASGKHKDITSGFVVEPFSTEVVGEYDLVVNFGSLQPIKKTIKVTNDFIITGFEKPQFVAQYERNSSTKNTFVKTGTNGVKGFEITENIYVVGNENEFIFKPTLSIYKKGSNQDLTEFKTKIKVYILNLEDVFEELTDNIDDYVEIDDYKQKYNFTNLAEGKIFKISVRPYFVSEDEEDLVDDCEFIFKVVKGYNVYNVQDLSVFDNANLDNKWAEYKQANDIDLNKQISGIILQNDISVTKDDIPSSHFYTQSEVSGDIDELRALGSLKDASDGAFGSIYRRQLTASETFTFEGNYFKISAEEIPLIVREFGEVSTSSDATITTHTTLFFINGATGSNNGNFSFNNVSFVGNSKKSEDATKSGGLVCFKSNNSNFTYYNCLSQGWFINTFFEFSSGTTSIIKNSNIFDANDTLLYCYGVSDISIIDSHMIGAGGPVMICDHVDHDSNGNGGYITNVKTKNSVLESFVAGSENWFQAYKATTLAGNIKAMNAFFTPYGKTILDSTQQKFNLITVNKSGSSQSITSNKIQGTFKDETLDDNEQSLYSCGLDLSAESIALIKQQVIEAMASQGMDSSAIASACEKMAILQTANSEICVPGDGSWIVEPNAQNMAQASGYLFVYLFNNMGATLGFSNLA